MDLLLFNVNQRFLMRKARATVWPVLSLANLPLRRLSRPRSLSLAASGQKTLVNIQGIKREASELDRKLLAFNCYWGGEISIFLMLKWSRGEGEKLWSGVI